ncbi:MAG: aminotransferase class I/II-fold pyridoxal phosphate-dependent enzyme [Actinomycetes bacterium]
MSESAQIPKGIQLPPYPYDRLEPLKQLALDSHGSVIDFSVGTPCDPPAESVLNALAESADNARSYPPSIGTRHLRGAASDWFATRLGLEVPITQIAACVGSKEFVAGLPHWLRLRHPSKDTVLYPAISYPSYEMGALLAGCRAVAVPVDLRGRLDLAAIEPEDAARALCLWSNSPGNPTGALDDLALVAEWGRAHQIPVFSDECYLEFTWKGPPASPGQLPGQSILSSGLDGVVAVHSLSKRSNLAGIRVGFYAGDAELVHYLSEIRKHGGLMVPGPAQHAAVAALNDSASVLRQRDRYWSRLGRVAALLNSMGLDAPLPAGAFYLWVPAPDGDAWAVAERLARELGVLVSPGEFYGRAASGFVRVAVVQGEAQLENLDGRAQSILGG